MAEDIYTSSKELLPVGRTDTPTISIPDDAKEFKAAVSRDAWLDIGRDVVEVRVELSLDGGQSWQFSHGFTAQGGTLTDRPESSITFPLPEGKERLARVSVERKATLLTALKVSVENVARLSPNGSRI